MQRQQQCAGSNAEGLMGLQQRKEAGLTQCSVAAWQCLQEDSVNQHPRSFSGGGQLDLSVKQLGSVFQLLTSQQ